MATKNCPKCAESIQDNAKKCKHCYADLRNWFIRHKIITGILAFILFTIFLTSFGNSSEIQKSVNNDRISNNNQTTEQIVTVTASQLYSEYKQNELAANNKYKGKKIEVSGTIFSIEKMFGQKFITLNTGDIIGKVQCFLNNSEISKAVNLTVGQQISLIGKKDGMSFNVIVKGCVIK